MKTGFPGRFVVRVPLMLSFGGFAVRFYIVLD